MGWVFWHVDWAWLSFNKLNDPPEMGFYLTFWTFSTLLGPTTNLVGRDLFEKKPFDPLLANRSCYLFHTPSLPPAFQDLFLSGIHLS
jgi:hypothetical protein